MNRKSLIQIGITANMFEWYQFCIAAFLAPSIGHLFFNSNNNFYATLQGFGLFAISYLFRPLGSIIFGLIGDKHGTAKSLQLSLATMTIPSILIGMLPTFSTIGYLSTFTLIILRLIQGFGAGGELPNSAAYLYQNSEKSRYHTVYCSLVIISCLCGVLLASFVIFILHLFLTIDIINDWGWRIPFLLGIPMSFMILRVRNNISHTKLVQQTTNYHKSKDKIVFKFIHAISLVGCEQVGFYTLFIWLPVFLINQHHFKAYYISAANNLSILALMIVTLISAYLCNKFGHRLILKVSSFSITISTIPLFLLLLTTHNIVLLCSILLLFALTLGALEGVVIFALSKIFNGNQLNSGIAISFTFASVIFGGTSPVICTYFTHVFNLNYFAAIYVTLFACIYFMVELFTDSKI